MNRRFFKLCGRGRKRTNFGIVQRKSGVEHLTSGGIGAGDLRFVESHCRVCAEAIDSARGRANGRPSYRKMCGVGVSKRDGKRPDASVLELHCCPS